jgi:UDP-N-acetylglucosamine 2-epimerase (non-hydrolysing)
MKRILVVFGTRPEAIKLAPVIRELKRSRKLRCLVCLTGQHRSMAQQVIDFFKIPVDYDLRVMKKGQDLEYLTKTITQRISALLDKVRPDWVVIQGDTTTVFLVALAAFYKKISVAHVEAGLRTNNKYYPFPEEINRRLVSPVADLHFAPTDGAKRNLLRERIAPGHIFVTGNTAIDALLWAATLVKKSYPAFSGVDFSKKIVLVTAHRRESFGRPLEEMFKAFRDIVRAVPDAAIVYPVHLNPNVQTKARKILAGHKGIHLIPPLPYGELVFLMQRCYLILTDSGGIQEEAPSLGKPVLVMREETERPEGIALGVSRLVGRNRQKIARETVALLRSARSYRKMIKWVNPYGDGHAAERIRKIFEKEG